MNSNTSAPNTQFTNSSCASWIECFTAHLLNNNTHMLGTSSKLFSTSGSMLWHWPPTMGLYLNNSENSHTLISIHTRRSCTLKTSGPSNCSNPQILLQSLSEHFLATNWRDFSVYCSTTNTPNWRTRAKYIPSATISEPTRYGNGSGWNIMHTFLNAVLFGHRLVVTIISLMCMDP